MDAAAEIYRIIKDRWPNVPRLVRQEMAETIAAEITETIRADVQEAMSEEAEDLRESLSHVRKSLETLLEEIE